MLAEFGVIVFVVPAPRVCVPPDPDPPFEVPVPVVVAVAADPVEDDETTAVGSVMPKVPVTVAVPVHTPMTHLIAIC